MCARCLHSICQSQCTECRKWFNFAWLVDCLFLLRWACLLSAGDSAFFAGVGSKAVVTSGVFDRFRSVYQLQFGYFARLTLNISYISHKWGNIAELLLIDIAKLIKNSWYNYRLRADTREECQLSSGNLTSPTKEKIRQSTNQAKSYHFLHCIPDIRTGKPSLYAWISI